MPLTFRDPVTENLAFLRGWQRLFHGDSFVYDYPLGRAHYGDFGYVHIARVISSDIKQLHKMGLDGYISCQELRVSSPNALPNYVMGYTLFDESADPVNVLVPRTIPDWLPEEYVSVMTLRSWVMVTFSTVQPVGLLSLVPTIPPRFLYPLMVTSLTVQLVISP